MNIESCLNSVENRGYTVVSKEKINDYDNVYEVSKNGNYYIVKFQEKTPEATNEINIYKLLRGKGISVKLIDSWECDDLTTNKRMVYMIMDKWDGSLMNILDEINRNNPEFLTVQNMSYLSRKNYNEIIDIINKFHDLKLIHNDLHAGNILYKWVNGDYKFALIDFQFTKIYKSETDIFKFDVIKDLYMIFNDLTFSAWLVIDQNHMPIGLTFKPFIYLNNPNIPIYEAYRYFRMLIMQNTMPMYKIIQLNPNTPELNNLFEKLFHCDGMYEFMGYEFTAPDSLYDSNRNEWYKITTVPLNKKFIKASKALNNGNMMGQNKLEIVDSCICADKDGVLHGKIIKKSTNTTIKNPTAASTGKNNNSRIRYKVYGWIPK